MASNAFVDNQTLPLVRQSFVTMAKRMVGRSRRWSFHRIWCVSETRPLSGPDIPPQLWSSSDKRTLILSLESENWERDIKKDAGRLSRRRLRIQETRAGYDIELVDL